MKLTNGEVFNARVPLEQLSALKFPVKTSLALVKLAQKLQEFFLPVDKVRDGLIRQYGESDPENPQLTRVKPDSENWGKFITEMQELLSQEVEVVFETVALPEELEIEPTILMALSKFVEVESKINKEA